MTVDIRALIASGILEQYCLGFASNSERALVESCVLQYPEIKKELENISRSLESYIINNPIEPPPSLKGKVLLSIYELDCGPGKKYPPVVKEDDNTGEFKEWLKEIEIPSPPEPFDNLFMYDLPSTDAVTNFMVWAKKGHDQEDHNDFIEYIVILEGHCDMFMNGEKKHYTAGQIIRIPPFTPHYAVITSDDPMVAIVQRKFHAAWKISDPDS